MSALTASSTTRPGAGAPLDLSRPVKTVDNRPARVICSDRRSIVPGLSLIVLIEEPNGTETVRFYFPDGTSPDPRYEPNLENA